MNGSTTVVATNVGRYGMPPDQVSVVPNEGIWVATEGALVPMSVASGFAVVLVMACCLASEFVRWSPFFAGAPALPPRSLRTPMYERVDRRRMGDWVIRFLVPETQRPL